jgi:hypothetical protein
LTHGQLHGWQEELTEQDIENRLIRIHTGFGKTQGVLAAAWLWIRVILRDDPWTRNAGVDTDGWEEIAAGLGTVREKQRW